MDRHEGMIVKYEKRKLSRDMWIPTPKLCEPLNIHLTDFNLVKDYVPVKLHEPSGAAR